MKKQLIASAIIAALSLDVAYAYQAELNGGVGYGRVNVSGGDISAVDAAVGVTVYLDPVATNRGPLAEAAFINRASSGTVVYNYVQTNIPNSSDLKAQSVVGQFDYYVPQTNLYLSGNVGRSIFNVSGGNATTYGGEIGVLPVTNLLLAIGDVSARVNSDTRNDPTIRAKYLTQIAEHAVNLEARAQFGKNTTDGYRVAGDYYLDRTLSLGADYTLQTEKGFDNAYSFGLNARKFFAENCSVQVNANVGRDNNRDHDYGFGVAGTYRF